MLLKPATPLTILLLVAFVLLLLSVLSTPIIKSIPLGTFDDVDVGVFGYCKHSQCSSIHVGYNTNGIFNSSNDSSGLNLPTSTRNSLSTILIVHPVAAFLTLLCLGMAFAAHFHAPSHSPWYLLALLILLLPTLLFSLLAFLVDILLFVPHLQWGGWIVLAATIILVSCGVITCAMRRTLVSRKARKRRIAEHPEMNGAGFYSRQNTVISSGFAKAESPPPLSIDHKAPLNSSVPASESAPTFTTFEVHSRGLDDSGTVNSRTFSDASPPPIDDRPRYGYVRGDTRSYDRARDEYSNPPPPGPSGVDSGMPRMPSDPRLQNQASDSNMGPPRGPQGYIPRGRGGYPIRAGYGRGVPYGRGFPPNGRGGAIGSMRGGLLGAGGIMMERGQRSPPPGYPQRRDITSGGLDPYGNRQDRRPPPFAPAYTPDRSGDYGYEMPPMRRPCPGSTGVHVVRDTDGPIGQAIEMGPQNDSNPSANHPGVLRNDPEVVGMTGLEQQPSRTPDNTYTSARSYMPPRAAWGAQRQTEQTLPPRISPAPESQQRTSSPPPPTLGFTDSYSEDVDPRFAKSPEVASSATAVPSALLPGPPGETKLKVPLKTSAHLLLAKPVSLPQYPND